ncbi:hypothetical protein ACE939_04790 [Aquimarina sp. W85]|uniref:hypothetical protein n=1 Tax=Aquimarina rhodophyticola TaxID=3342246 RepID=UPI003671561F
MLLYINSFANRKTEKINELVGPPFSFIKKLVSGSVFSKYFDIEQLSPNITKIVGNTLVTTKAKIEMRPRGIIIKINSVKGRCLWVIPFYQLYYYDKKTISIHAQGSFINFEKGQKLNSNQNFLEHLIAQKLKYDSNHPHVDSI